MKESIDREQNRKNVFRSLICGLKITGFMSVYYISKTFACWHQWDRNPKHFHTSVETITLLRQSSHNVQRQMPSSVSRSVKSWPFLLPAAEVGCWWSGNSQRLRSADPVTVESRVLGVLPPMTWNQVRRVYLDVYGSQQRRISGQGGREPKIWGWES